ncbi:hypothetical protein EV127DRAFT_360258 [Xylaria flabelliformis]|nr:hypothetical protein EV127DRAFT_360258 [Xylaria flabelliformis]
MSTITPGIRAAGWNVLFTIGRGKDPCAFAGIYQVVGSDFVTFRDVCDELRLCFKFPKDVTGDETDSKDEDGANNDDPWDSIAFAFADRSRLSPDGLSFVHGQLLDKPVPSLPPLYPKIQDALQYHIVFHKTCGLLPSQPLSAHLKTCSFKRSRSSSGSPARGLDDNDTAAIDMLVPKSLEVNEDAAKLIQDNFRHSCLARGTCCAVSRQGESWCLATSMGPGIQACHIVPPMQYHLYPSGDDDTTIDTSQRGLVRAWEKTWSPNNGILLDKTLRELFDARLFSIHPTTFQIRTFVPYDKLIQYHGKEALIHQKTDLNALRHHYEMCCIENMTAEKPRLEEVLSRSPSELSIATPPLTPASEVGKTVDPSKKRRASPLNQSWSQDTPRKDDLVEEAEGRGGKRRRLSQHHWYDYSEDEEDTLDNFLAP